ncbi:MAG: hypothetical protein ACI9WC_002464 [Arenicella sp.]|jgi:hypothetical protein
MSRKRKTPSPPKRRNSVALNPLLKKSHAHSTSKKAERAKDKQALKKQLAKDQ